MYIEDAVQAVYELYRHLPSEKDSPKISEIVNVASRDTRVLRSFVEEVWKEAGGRGSLEYGSFVQAKEGALSVRPSVEKLAALTGGFKEAYSFSQGIRQMLITRLWMLLMLQMVIAVLSILLFPFTRDGKMYLFTVISLPSKKMELPLFFIHQLPMVVSIMSKKQKMQTLNQDMQTL